MKSKDINSYPSLCVPCVLCGRIFLLVTFLVLSLIYPISSFANSSGVVFPITSTKVSSSFGNRIHPIKLKNLPHQGIDIAAPLGTKVRAISEGIVVFVGVSGGYGNLVVVKHSSEITSHYGHLRRSSVQVGQSVKPGSIIGEVGETGNVTGPHLHFEIRVAGAPINPEDLLGDIRVKAQG